MIRLFVSLKDNLALHRLLRFRQRYILTRGNGLRVRYIAGIGACVFAGLLGFSSYSPFSGALQGGQSSKNGAFATAFQSFSTQDDDAGAMNGHISDDLKTQLSSSMRGAADLLKKADNQAPYRKVSIGKGDTIAGVLQNAGLSGQEAYHAVKALSVHFEPRRVKSGQKIGLHFKKNRKSGDMVFQKMDMKLSPVKEVVVSRKGDMDFKAELNEKELVKKTYGRFAKIETSLYGSAARAEIPASVIAEMIRIYSWDVDFQRDIRRGDRIEVLYEAFETEDGDFAKYGNILFANLSIGGDEVPVYRFEMANGRVDYFEPDGTSVRKTLMKTPVDGARISSGYGMRKHPVLGYNKMHKGMDFAAPTGTPIYAAGDGVIDYIGRKGGYGNYIRIRHNSKLKTAYAHMHKFKKGMGQGKRVEQGDVIGYVGSTGRSTGPHLHYEVHVNGAQINPRSVDLPTGEILGGKQLVRFKSFIEGLNRQYVSLIKGQKFAARASGSKREIH